MHIHMLKVLKAFEQCVPVSDHALNESSSEILERFQRKKGKAEQNRIKITKIHAGGTAGRL